MSTDEEAGVYVGLKNGVPRADFEAALTSGKVLDLLHRIPTKPDSYIFIPGGRLHAIGAGNVMFEIQQNSDTTYRVFDWNRVGTDGEPRKLHIEESLKCINFDDFEPALDKSDTETLVTCDWFHIERWFLNERRQANLEPKFAVFQVVAGTVSFGTRFFRSGDLLLVPAGSHQAEITPQGGAATVLRTTI